MSVESFTSWLYATPVSTTIRDVTWVVPTVQSIHILSIAALVGATLVSDLRLAGLIATDQPASAIVRRHLPWIWTALVILLATGLTLLVGEPERTVINRVFWLKMAMVLTAFTLTMIFRRPLLDERFSFDHPQQLKRAKIAAWVSLILWIGIIFCGRWIAYVK